MAYGNLRKMSRIRVNVINAESDFFEIYIIANGYGTIEIRSVTRGEFLGRIQITERDIDREYYYSYSYPGRIDLREYDTLPLGTVALVGEYNSNAGGAPDTQFLSISRYNFYDYRDRYYAQLESGMARDGMARVRAAQIRNLTDDWNCLMNLFFYLEATGHGGFGYNSRSHFRPTSGLVITADMYNELIDMARSCANAVGVYTSFPPYVRRGDIIPANFLSVLGDIANSCIAVQKSKSNNH